MNGNPNDPLLKQVLPVKPELDDSNYITDPVDESNYNQ